MLIVGGLRERKMEHLLQQSKLWIFQKCLDFLENFIMDLDFLSFSDKENLNQLAFKFLNYIFNETEK